MRRTGIIVVLAVLMMAGMALARDPYVGWRVNTSIDYLQYDPQVAAQEQADGGYISAWCWDQRDDGTGNITAQLYDSNWDDVGGEIALFPFSTALPSPAQRRPAIELAGTGVAITSEKWVASWVDTNLDVTVAYGVGSSVSSTFTITPNDGVVPWADVDISRDGTKIGVAYHQDADGDGTEEVNWAQYAWGSSTASASGTIARATGEPAGTRYGRVAMDTSGGMIVAYYGDDAGTSSNYQYFQMFDSTGTQVKAETAVGPDSDGTSTPWAGASNSDVDVNASGMFAIAHEESDEQYFSVYDANGDQIGTAVHVDDTGDLGSGQDNWNSVAIDDAGNVAAVAGHPNASLRHFAYTPGAPGGEYMAIEPIVFDPFNDQPSSGQDTAYPNVDIRPDGTAGMIVGYDDNEPGDYGADPYGEFQALGTGIQGFILGDLNSDGIVDGLDLTALAGNWDGTDLNYWEGDINNDGTVDGLDLTALAANWDESLAGPMPNIPEPATLGLLALGGLAVLRRRRR